MPEFAIAPPGSRPRPASASTSTSASALALSMVLSLSACALVRPPAPPPPIAVAPVPAPRPVEVPRPPPDELAPLLAYHQSLRRMSQGDLIKELSGLGLQQRSPRVALQMGMALMLTRGGGDLARAQALLDSVVTSADEEAAQFKPLAQLLSSNCAEARRLAEHADKLALQLKDNQRRTEQLSEMVEGLKAIERSLPAKPAASAQAAVK